MQLYGAGAGCASFFSIVQPKLGTSVVGILDRNVEGSVCGLKISHPELDEIDASATAIIVTIGDKRSFAECKPYLEARFGIPVFWMLDMYEFHSHFPTSVDIDSLLPGEEDVCFTCSLLEDRLSQDIFRQVIRSHADRHFIERPCADLSTQYLVPELTLPMDIGHIVHCGAHRGGTLQALSSYFRSIESLSCFEPTPAFQEDLQKQAQSLRNCGEVAIHAVAIGEQYQEIQLEEFGGASTNNRISLITEQRSESTSRSGIALMVAIDEVFRDCPVDYISMDIEGGEIAALRGAQDVIAKQHPRLAISVYHSPQDIWMIPQQIESFAPGVYQMYLRRHTPFNAETLLYCIPR